MAFAFNGIGTKYYGEADEGLDGSYTTTEWIVILWLPLLPLRSVRVTGRKGANYDSLGSLRWSNRKFEAREAALNVRQVAIGYACTALVVLVVWLLSLATYQHP